MMIHITFLIVTNTLSAKTGLLTFNLILSTHKNSTLQVSNYM